MGAPGAAKMADGVDQRHPVVGQKLRDAREKGVIVFGTDMLEHADRDDAVETALNLAIVLEPDTEPVSASPTFSARSHAIFACSLR